MRMLDGAEGLDVDGPVAVKRPMAVEGRQTCGQAALGEAVGLTDVDGLVTVERPMAVEGRRASDGWWRSTGCLGAAEKFLRVR